MEHNLLFVVLMGMGTVFFGLICIIFLTYLMGKVMGAVTKSPAPAPAAAAPVPTRAAAPAPAAPEGIAPEVIAAITAALSEEVGIPSRGVNITNIKKL
ncbi:MAG: OadG family protein [Oscillospiraceae bacterium]|jgi:sodium pump decarboxylase gamma subunit|nr:OadG family protein [Oscillospiraceae bacterium]MBQ1620399.1 OadG family protein [Oscillospiraceae bacterium]MBQ1743063.1 OadG family protein [Oscillospiraceae bacterium]MBQ1805300.1 OadG family protein [Oscillospiraceae bacterium]MBQ2178203.1 OadG family protein [Oscillospiraceae bacterium]